MLYPQGDKTSKSNSPGYWLFHTMTIFQCKYNFSAMLDSLWLALKHLNILSLFSFFSQKILLD